MDEREFLAQQFEEKRGHLRAVAYRMLGSLSEAEDAVQEAWLRLNRSDAGTIENLGGWLTTVVGRVCLDMLRSRLARREEALETQVAEPAAPREGVDPEEEAVLADSVGIALLVVLDRLSPAERLSFVLHDLFGVSFEEIARIIGRSPAAARQSASRARRRVQGAEKIPASLSPQRKVVDAFLAALRSGDFEGIVAVLDPEVVVRIDEGAARPGAAREIRGAQTWAKGAIAFSQATRVGIGRPALLDGKPGLMLVDGGHLLRAVQFTFANGKIAQVEIVGDPVRLREMEVRVLE